MGVTWTGAGSCHSCSAPAFFEAEVESLEERTLRDARLAVLADRLRSKSPPSGAGPGAGPSGGASGEGSWGLATGRPTGAADEGLRRMMVSGARPLAADGLPKETIAVPSIAASAM
jgi:hypothetical protein